MLLAIFIVGACVVCFLSGFLYASYSADKKVVELLNQQGISICNQLMQYRLGATEWLQVPVYVVDALRSTFNGR